MGIFFNGWLCFDGFLFWLVSEDNREDTACKVLVRSACSGTLDTVAVIRTLHQDLLKVCLSDEHQAHNNYKRPSTGK